MPTEISRLWLTHAGPTACDRRLLVGGLLLAQAALLAAGAARHSPVMDETAHLAAGISHWELGSFALYKVNPPLVRMIAALPALAVGAESDWRGYFEGVGERPEFAVMDDFARANGPQLFWLVTLARWGLIPLMLLGGCICYRWARELYGEAAGIVALLLWCLCPNMLAYGQVINADAGATALGAAASYCFWKWLRDPAWDRALMAGITLGLAELTKTTWVVLFALWPALWIVVRGPWSVVCGEVIRWGRRKTSPKPTGQNSHEFCYARARGQNSHEFCRQLAQLAVALALGVFCINAGYDFEGSGTRLDNYLFVSRPLTGAANDGRAVTLGNRFAKTWLGRLRVPLPKAYVEGMDLQWHDIETSKPSYLRGRWQERGWWHWHLYALAVKVPLGTWGLLVLAIGLRAARRCGDGGAERRREGEIEGKRDGRGEGGRATWRDEIVLLAPAAVVLTLVSSQTGFSRYLRYVLPVLPCMFIWTGSVARLIAWQRWRVALAPAVLLAWSVGSSLWYAPHWMSYFNELAGGPVGGPAHLIDAQVDWGQDLLYLKRWLDAHPEAKPLRLAYFGPVDPRLAGIEFALPPKGLVSGDDRSVTAEPPTDLRPGWYAVSVNFLHGYPARTFDGHGGRDSASDPVYGYFRRFKPAATAGYSIYIYHLTACDLASRGQLTNRVFPAADTRARSPRSKSAGDGRSASSASGASLTNGQSSPANGRWRTAP